MLPAAGLTTQMDAIPQYGKQIQYTTANVNSCILALFFWERLGRTDFFLIFLT